MGKNFLLDYNFQERDFGFVVTATSTAISTSLVAHAGRLMNILTTLD